MTKECREEAIKYIMAQLEDGYIDLGFHDKDELEIIKEAMKTLKFIDAWNDIPLMTTEYMKIGYTEEAAKELAESSRVWL